ncbi:hypothetical protein PPYR_08592 [Photinus pyralis]|uniref:t-SNARE coiled-coil homology domain-containing protein n=1 Tax=Photinus pyralis TaxID=7054 RepID=A0A1Y1N6H8_PHOPY|nr:syntaxin-12 [Photinus pyralis]KAB0797599.1 hypothetical protein PPYR_08592 [Photinus pyralis]
MDSFSSYHNGGQNREQDYQKLSQTIGSSIEKISHNVSSMQRMITQIGSHQDSRELRKQLHSIQHYTQQLVKDTNGYIKDLSNIPPAALASEQRERKLQRDRLQDEFTSTLNMFQAALRSAAHKEKEIVNKAKVQAYGDPFAGGPRRDQQLIELQDSNVSKQQMQLQEEEDLEMLREQEIAINKLERDIVDVNQIFKELGAMVHEQGEIVDSIEASVERTNNYVSDGAQQLRQAQTYKNKVMKKKCILAIIAAVVLTVIILIIVYSVK